MNSARPPANGYQSRIHKSNALLRLWTVAWGATTFLMASGPRLLWNKVAVFTLLAVALNFGVGVGLILAHKNYIAELDELQRKVHFNALAITVGVAMIAGIPYSVMDRDDVIPFPADISHMVLLMTLTFVASLRYGKWRYR